MKKPRMMAPLKHEQDAVQQDYKNFPALHLFFSPRRIPVGLTDEEVRICVNLYPLRKKQQDRNIQRRLSLFVETYDPTLNLGQIAQAYIDSVGSLPEEFSPRKPMTRSRFRRGILKFIAQAHL